MNLIEPLIVTLRSRYPSLSDQPIATLATELQHEMQLIDAQPGDLLFEEGKPCIGFPLVLEGEICVSRSSADSGRTMELYRVTPGEICVVSASSLLGHRNMNAHATAVAPTRLLLLTPALFERWTAQPAFRQFVFGVFSERLSDLMTLLDAVAFQRLDRRLAQHLLGHGQTLRTTHQALADELGTVREIVTRLLNRFEAAGLVALSRERIEVIDAQSLRMVASGQFTSF